jgi:hypothetical protein
MSVRTTYRLTAAATVLFTATLAPALTVTLSDAAASYAASFPGPCTGPGGPWPGCSAVGYLSYSNTQAAHDTFVDVFSFHSSQAASLGDLNFATAFDNFGVGNGWTLVELPALANLTYDITNFRTDAGASLGGININVNVTTGAGYNGPALSSLVWSQALLINYSVTDGSAFFDPPKNVMDDYSFSQGSTGSGGAFQNPCTAIPASPNNTTPSTIPATPANRSYCDPIYPFQYGDRHFSDGPHGGYPMDSFRAEAFLSTVNTATKTLTIYDGGVNYGFDLYVAPEPGTWAFGGIGILLVAVARVRRRRSVTLKSSGHVQEHQDTL